MARRRHTTKTRIGARRRTFGFVGAAFAGAVLLASTTGPAASPCAPTGLRVASSSTSTVSPADIISALNPHNTPVSYVVLVDVSGSMLSDGLFTQVRNDFPDLMSQFGPNDDVAVDTFGDEPETLRALGPVDQGSNPAHALDGVRVDPEADTDTGGALQLAYNQLAGNKTGPTPVGVVLLLTDGKPDPPASSAFHLSSINTLSSPTDLTNALDGSGPWRDLRTDFAKLAPQMTVLGCGLALQSGLDLSPVIGYVFANPLVDDQPQVPTLHSFVQQAQSTAQTKQAAGRLQADSAAGVTARITASGGASWQGYPLAGGTASATVTFTANSRYVPLVVSNARVTTTGGLSVTANGLPASVSVSPGHPAAYPVTLTWPKPDASSLSGDPKPISAQLRVTGSVSSPWAATIVSSFDPDYVPGTLAASAATLSGTVPGSVDSTDVLVWVLILAALAACALAWFFSYYRKLGGGIEIGASGAFGYQPLPTSRRVVFAEIEVGGEIAKVVVRSARRRRGGRPAMWIRCVPQGTRAVRAGGRCEWSGTLILAGSWQFQHRPAADAQQPV